MKFFFTCLLGVGLLSAPAASAAHNARTQLQRQDAGNRTHTVQPKENFYSLSRKYKVPVQDLRKANPGVESLQVGQVINIPVKLTAKVPTQAAKPAAPAKAAPMPAAAKTFSVDTNGKKWHTVAPGQTLYSLSNLFEIPVEELQRLNHLTSTDVRAGQVLLVGMQAPPATAKVSHYVPEKDDEVSASTKPAEPVKLAPVISSEPEKKPEPEERAAPEPANATRIMQSGLASVINERFRSSKLLALHRTAPVGTLLQVKNSMNGKTVFVRVIGQLPDTGENDKVIVKISKKAYQKLGALDAKFLAEVSYAQ